MKHLSIIYGLIFCGLFSLRTNDALTQSIGSQFWFTYNHQAIVSQKWGYQFDLNHRTGMLNNMEAVVSAARFGGTYLIDNNHRMAAGYAWFGSHINHTGKEILTEHRLWQQYISFKTHRKTQFFHRIRMEERWREQTPQPGEKAGDTYFQVRPRYMFQLQGSVFNRATKPASGLWWQTAAEIMFQAGEGIDRHYFDQFRLIGGPLWQFNRAFSLAVLYQYINQYSISQKKHLNIHTVRFTLLHSLDFSGQKNKPLILPADE
jgi:hypothetical protein